MKYIVMCGGTYGNWNEPKQLLKICGEPLVARTIRLLRENGVDDIAISSCDDRFEAFGVPVLVHDNEYRSSFRNESSNGGSWAEAFYPMDDPACYLMGDVVYSPGAVRKIVETETDGIRFFASSPPFHPLYIKSYAEPFCFKVADQKRFRDAVDFTIANENSGLFFRRPIAWELWQVITGGELNAIDFNNIDVINDYTCDIDAPEEIQRIEEALERR